jgi:PhnB protein
MTTVNVYLTFKGNCEEAFNFYKSVFGGEFDYVGRFKDMPVMEGMEAVTPDIENYIMHVSLPIGEGTVLMGSDAAGDYAAQIKEGNNFSVSINAETKDDADRFFKELSDGGMVTMPMQETFWGAYFGSFVDKFGISWMVNFDLKEDDE